MTFVFKECFWSSHRSNPFVRLTVAGFDFLVESVLAHCCTSVLVLIVLFSCLQTVFELLKTKPEQERRLLSALVNKVCEVITLRSDVSVP